MYHAVVDEKTNKVVNIVIWDGKTQWAPPHGHYTVLCPHREGSIGDTYDTESKSFKKV